MPIRIGQIGTGHAHASGWMGVYRASKEYEVVGVVEPDAALRKRAEASPVYRGLKWLTREQLFNVEGLQAVAVETRVSDLLDNAEACIDAGFHVQLDKPAGTSLPHFARILDKAQRKHLLLQMGYMYRHNPAIVRLREFLEKGWLGELFEVRAVMSKVVSPAVRKQLAEFRGGMMFELACHVIDLVVDVLGEPKAVTAFSQHAASIEDELRDNMLAVFEYPRALASVKTAAMEVEGFSRRHLTVCGSEGTFHVQPLDAPNLVIALDRNRDGFRKGVQQVELGRYPRYVGDAAEMARIIRGDADAHFTPQHDLAVQRTILLASGMSTE